MQKDTKAITTFFSFPLRRHHYLRNGLEPFAERYGSRSSGLVRAVELPVAVGAAESDT